MTIIDYKPMRLRLDREYARMSEQLENIRSGRFSEERHDSSAFGKLEEEAAETADMDNVLAQEECIVERLAEIEAALDKFRSGTFGLCEKCGQEIELARLEAMPTAKLCMHDAQNISRVRVGAGSSR